MYYSGYFRNTDTTVDKDGQLFKVVIITNFKNKEFETGGELLLSDSPFTVTYENEDSNIFKPYKCSTATVGLLQKEYNFEFSNTSGNNVLVMLLKSKNDKTEEDYKDLKVPVYNKNLYVDNLVYTVEWIGFATPNTYSQEFENFYDSFELEAQDSLSTLQFFKYPKELYHKENSISYGSTFIPAIVILQYFVKFLCSYKNIYVHDTLRVPTQEDADILNFCCLDQRNFFDEDAVGKTQLEVVEQIMTYFNLTAIPYGDSLYIVDYVGLKNGFNYFYHYKDSSANVYPFVAYNSVVDFTLTGKVKFEDLHDIKENDFSSTGTKLTLLSTFNKMSVKDSLYSFDTIAPVLDNADNWENTPYYDKPTVYDTYNVISEAGGEYITDYDRSKAQYVEWDYEKGTAKKRSDDNKDLTVICNSRISDKKQKCYLRYINLKDNDFFNNATIECFAYDRDLLGVKGYRMVESDVEYKNSYLNANGNIVSVPLYEWYISKYKSVSTYPNLELYFEYNNLVSNICFYDGSYKFLGSQQVSTSNYLKVSYPNNAVYFRLCWGEAKTGTDVWSQYFTYYTTKTDKYTFGSRVENKGTYNFMRNHVCSQLIAYDTQEVEYFSDVPKKIELKPAILISTPSNFTNKDYVDRKYNWYSEEEPLQPMFKIRSKSISVGSGDYLYLTGKIKYFKNNDCLPIEEPTDNTKVNAVYWYIRIKFSGKCIDGKEWQYEMSQLTGNYYCIFKVGEDNCFGKEFEFANTFNFKDKLGIENGIVFEFPYSDTENAVGIGNVEITFYRPMSPADNVPAYSCLISDLDISVVTKSDVNGVNYSSDDTDTEYSNVLDEEAVEEKGSIELDITTWDNKQPNYSSVIYSDKKDSNNNDYFRLKHIYNRTTGEILRAEEQIIINNVTQYSTPTVSLNLNLHKFPLPYSLFTYHYFKDKLFIVDGCELDYVDNSYNINLVEKK